MTEQPNKSQPFREDALRFGDRALYNDSNALYSVIILRNLSNEREIRYTVEFGRMLRQGRIPQIPDGLVRAITKRRDCQYHQGVWRLEPLREKNSK